MNSVMEMPGANSSPMNASAKKTESQGRFRELNQLKNQLKDAQLKKESQDALLNQHQSKIVQLEKQLNSSQHYSQNQDTGAQTATKSNVGILEPEVLKVQQDSELLRKSIASLAASVADGTERLLHNEIAAELQQEELVIQKRKCSELSQLVSDLKEALLRSEQEAKAADEEALHLRERLSKSEETCLAERTRAEQSETEAKLLSEIKLRGEADREAFERLREHVLETTRENVRKQNELRGALQNAQQMAQELALELRRSSEGHAAERTAKDAEHKRESEQLHQRLKALNLRASAETEQLHREHIEIVYALRQQFLEYQTTAERLFCAEAEAFEEQYRAQVQRYDEQLGHVVRTKDFLFHAMAAAKDAKIMSLIDGTDFQKVLIRHQTELEVQRQAHLQEIANVRQRVEAEQRRLVYQLKKQATLQQLELDKAASQRSSLDAEITRLTSGIKQTRRVAAQRETALEQALQEAQRKLRATEDRCLALSRERELERHRALRYKLQLEGRLDGSVAATAIRLQRESERLKHDSDLLSIELKERSEQATAATRMAQRAATAIAEMEVALRKKTNDYLSLLKTFEFFLLGKKQSGSGANADGTHEALSTTLRSLAENSATTSQGVLRKAVEATLRSATSSITSSLATEIYPTENTPNPVSIEATGEDNSNRLVEELVISEEVLSEFNQPTKIPLKETGDSLKSEKRSSESSETARAPQKKSQKNLALGPIREQTIVFPSQAHVTATLPQTQQQRLPPALRRVFAENASSDATHAVIAQLSQGYQKLTAFRKLGLQMASAAATGKPGSVAEVLLSTTPSVPATSPVSSSYSSFSQSSSSSKPIRLGAGEVRLSNVKARAGHLFRSLSETHEGNTHSKESQGSVQDEKVKMIIQTPDESNLVEQLSEQIQATELVGQRLYGENDDQGAEMNIPYKSNSSLDMYNEAIHRHNSNPRSEAVSSSHDNLKVDDDYSEVDALDEKDILKELSETITTARETLFTSNRSRGKKTKEASVVKGVETGDFQQPKSFSLSITGDKVKSRPHTIADAIDEEREMLKKQIDQRKRLLQQKHLGQESVNEPGKTKAAANSFQQLERAVDYDVDYASAQNWADRALAQEE